MLKFKLLIVLSVFTFINTYSQEREIYYRIKIDGNLAEQSQIARTYFIDEAIYSNDYLTAEIPSEVLDQLRADGIPFSILIEDMEQFYANRLKEKSTGVEKALTCVSKHIPDPSNFHLGSMGGYLTYQEILTELDEMAAAYPTIFKAKAQVGTFLTHQNRPIYYVKISDNPNSTESEPRVLYSAHIHAREAVTSMQLIYYMWYMLENYNSNPEIKYLIDNSEMYFIPIANPDGFMRNQTNSPGGGGMHRKNMRNVGTTNPGVDINRNFDIQWGTTGVSGNTNNDTYPGPSAASEPETQAYKWFAEEYDFVASFTHHAHGNLLLFPFGYDYVVSPDSAFFQSFTEEMVSINGFNNTQSVNLYPASGDTDDWLYTSNANKPKVFAMTPETGRSSDGFWPAQSRILPISRANLKMNIDLVRFATKTAFFTETGNYYINNLQDYIHFDFKRYGIENGNFVVTLVPLSSEIMSVGAPITITNPIQLQSYVDSISFNLDPNIQIGTELKFALNIDNGDVVFSDTLNKEFGLGSIVFQDDASALANFTSTGGTWGTSNSSYVSAPSSITDSPAGNYASNSNKSLFITQPVSLMATNGNAAALTYWAKWNLEEGYDYVQIEASSDSGLSWTPLCGKYTKLGGPNQDEDKPLYDGVQTTWVKEEISLNAYVGSSVQVRFQLVSNNSSTRDGFYFDDLHIYFAYSTVGLENDILSNIRLYPNPSEQYIHIEGKPEGQAFELIDASGKVLLIGSQNQLDISNLRSGLYILRIGNTSMKIIKK